MLPQFRTFGLAREILGFQGESGGLAALPTALTINSTTVEPTYWYQAKDASTSTWTTTAGSGGTLTGAGSGGTVGLDSPTPNSADRSANLAGTRYYTGAADSWTNEDAVVECVVQFAGALTSGGIANNMDTNQYGWSVTHDNSVKLTLRLSDGVTGVNGNSANFTSASTWHHCICFVDKSGSLQWYINGAASGAAVDISSVGDLSETNLFHLGTRWNDGSQVFGSQGNRYAHFAMWRQASWLSTHLNAAVALERYARAFGLYATGATLQSNSRASAAYVDRVSHVDGIRRLHYVGSGVHRMGRAYDKHLRVGAGVLSEAAATNLCLQSQALNTTWAKIDAGDTVDETNAEAPDGTTTMNLITGDATDGEHGVSQSITLTAAAHTMACYFEAGTAGWAYMDVSTIANVSAYFDLGSGIVGTVGSAATADIEYLGNNKYRAQLRYTGTAAAHTHRIVMAEADGDKSTASKTMRAWQVDVTATAVAVSPIPTTTTTVTRVADAIVYDASGLNFARGTLAADVLQPVLPTGTYRTILHISDGTESERIVMNQENDNIPGLYITDGGAGQVAVIDGSTSVSDNVWHEARATWQANDAKLYVGGTNEGTNDSSCTIPSDAIDEVRLGEQTGGFYFNGLVLPRIYSKPTLKNVTDFGDLVAHAAAYVSSASGVALNASTYTAVGGTFTEINSADFTVSAAGLFTYDGTATKWFTVSCGCSQSSSAAMDPVLLGWLKNGTLATSGRAGRKIPINDVGRMAIPDFVQLANGDTLQLAALADTGTPTFTADYLTIVVQEVSG